MNAPRLPAVRLHPGGECLVQDVAIMDLPSDKLDFTAPLTAQTAPPNSDQQIPSSSELDSDSSGHDSSGEVVSKIRSTMATTTLQSNQYTRTPLPPENTTPTAPRFTRAFTTPLPSRLTQLRNPHRMESSYTLRKDPANSNRPESPELAELALELADSVQTVIQTMLQVSPSQVLDPAKEQLSACTLSIPTPSMAAIFAAMKNLNYLSANMGRLCSDNPDAVVVEKNVTSFNEFDVGEMLQSVGDALGGAASQLGVDLVLYHGDVGMKHVSVNGDEGGIFFALSHVIRQVLGTAERGDSIELGLVVTPIQRSREESSASTSDAPSADEYPPSVSPADLEGPVKCTFVICHKFASPLERLPSDSESLPHQIRATPSFSTSLLSRLLARIDATLIPDLPPHEALTDGRLCEITLTLERGSFSIANTPNPPMLESGIDTRIAEEPSLEQLTIFAESLRGKRVTLYASSKGSFAQHLTSYLTTWGMDVSHVSPGEGSDATAEPSLSFSPATEKRSPGLLPPSSASERLNHNSSSPRNGETGNANAPSPSFIFIDDDIDVLKERMQLLRTEHSQHQLTLNPRKRPPLTPHHRPKSSPQVARVMGHGNVTVAPPVVIVHFTSLANYKLVKEAIQSILTSYTSTTIPLPELMIVPKPVGPRRFLTALHTAVTKPLVDPIFTPIATTPNSPAQDANVSFFREAPHNTVPTSPAPKTHRPSGSRSNSDRSSRSSRDVPDHTNHPPPSPLSITDNVEYFSEAAAMLGTSASSGLVIQSPDGQPAGIFFHPRPRTSKTLTTHNMERDKGQLAIPVEPRKKITPRIVSAGSRSEATTSPKASFADYKAVAAASPKSPSKKPSTSDDLTPTEVTASSAVRKTSVSDMRKAMSPPSSPLVDSTTPSRRATAKRATLGTSGVNATKKADNIVPPISVLIVDDNPINQAILSTFMTKKKIKYDLASNGQEAVQKWRTGEFHLILMDIQMPIMDGIQATKEIRRYEKLIANSGYTPQTPVLDDQTTPVQTPSDSSTDVDTRGPSTPYRSSVIIVALTASSLQSDRVAALAAGCNDFLTKPVSLVWLNSKIIEWGSIKALQMWADLRPEVVRGVAAGQAAQAKNVADRLHVPKNRRTPPLSRSNTLPVAMSMPLGAAGGANAGTGSGGVASSSTLAGGVLEQGMSPSSVAISNGSVIPMASTSDAFWNQSRGSPASFWGGGGMVFHPGSYGNGNHHSDESHGHRASSPEDLNSSDEQVVEAPRDSRREAISEKTDDSMASPQARSTEVEIATSSVVTRGTANGDGNAMRHEVLVAVDDLGLEGAVAKSEGGQPHDKSAVAEQQQPQRKTTTSSATTEDTSAVPGGEERPVENGLQPDGEAGGVPL